MYNKSTNISKTPDPPPQPLLYVNLNQTLNQSHNILGELRSHFGSSIVKAVLLILLARLKAKEIMIKALVLACALACAASCGDGDDETLTWVDIDDYEGWMCPDVVGSCDEHDVDPGHCDGNGCSFLLWVDCVDLEAGNYDINILSRVN